MLICIETHRTFFQGGGGGGLDPLSPPLDLHLIAILPRSPKPLGALCCLLITFVYSVDPD